VKLGSSISFAVIDSMPPEIFLAQPCRRGRTIASLTVADTCGPSSISTCGGAVNIDRQFVTQYVSPPLSAIVESPASFHVLRLRRAAGEADRKRNGK
jgi:hypothetical protein